MKFKCLFLVFSFYIKEGISIHCYDCNSANNSMCLEPSQYDNELRSMFLRPVECSVGVHAPPGAQNFFCRKLVQTILHKHREPEVRVARGCGWIRHSRDCYKADTEDHLETACQCFHDECNTAVRNPANTSIILILASCIVGLNKF